ncbi:hypothetical protein BU14_0646s0001 [Porphyra umbilicalis]|uniref:Uncharacterized protein n=1 Tax=Porphyra umbilicalis TaxID=2786 RepID=A0A1X6NR46_PORUM|nr:hypothetical protein BU14_0646s0001 [Porphyra umbilicalis]|eukprot:OSX70873.1 hypothetical protein BU14_0646s0001 [Porphyra umbilicalis]
MAVTGGRWAAGGRPAGGRHDRRLVRPLGRRDSVETVAPSLGQNALASSQAAVRVTPDGTRAAVPVRRGHCWARDVILKVAPPLSMAAACGASTRPSAVGPTPTSCDATQPTRHGGVGTTADHPALAITAVLPCAPSSRAGVGGER